MSDRTVEALRNLLGESVDRRREVADRIGASEQYLYQLARGVPLASGKQRTVGREMRAKLDEHYPGWLSTSQTVSTTTPAPTLAQALEVLGIELAKEMPDDVRDDVADGLAKLARRRGQDRDQQQVLALLQATPSKRGTAA